MIRLAACTMQSMTKCQFVFSLHSGAVCAAVRIELLGKESLLMQHKILIAYFSASGVTAGVARENGAGRRGGPV